jgi:hypothetical protein
MPTDNERLDRIEQILEITLTLGQQFREDLIQIDQMTKRNASAITRLEEKVTQFVKQSIQDRETVTYEFRGLRLEMQRLIELTLGENNSAIADVDKQQQEFVETQKPDFFFYRKLPASRKSTSENGLSNLLSIYNILNSDKPRFYANSQYY